MKKIGLWTRWGRNGCEGWSLDIGLAFRGSVVKRQTVDQPTVWQASVNTTHLGDYADRDAAMKRVEETIEWDMRTVLKRWEAYRAAKASG